MTVPAPKFGTYALPARRETLRRKADLCANSTVGKWMISYYRKRAFKNLESPFDIAVMPGVNARLWPHGNRCEKRAFAGVHVWDTVEHSVLAQALAHSDETPFVFIDAGANVGLYSLLLSARAYDAGKPIRIVAIEPDTTNRGRLEFNTKSSQEITNTKIEVLPYAISDQDGEGEMVGGDTNRGEVHLGTNTTQNSVPIKTLLGICNQTGITRIDAMKMDIEGHDERALRAFFATAPQSLWPELMILETGREPTTPLLELCLSHGYTLNTRAGINSVLTRSH